MTITLRTATQSGATTKSSALTHAELDANFTTFMGSGGSAIVGYTPSGSGALTRTVSSRLGDFVTTSDYSTAANFRTAVSALTATVGVSALDIGSINSSAISANLRLLWNGSNRPLSVSDSSGNDLISINSANGARIDMHKYSTDGAIIVLGVVDSSFTTGVRAGHYAFSARDTNSQQHTISLVQATIDTVTPASLDSTISLYYMDHVDGTGGLQQPNKAVSVSRSGFSLPGIPITDSTGTVSISTTRVSSTVAGGTVATGTVNLISHTLSATGDSGGASSIRGADFSLTIGGGNATTTDSALRAALANSSTGAITTGIGFAASSTISNSGNITNNFCFRSAFGASNSGGSTVAVGFEAGAPTLSSTGAFATHAGFRAGNMGHASLITNALGFDCLDQTASVTLTVGYRSQVTSGTGKWGFYASGSANNGFVGKTIFGTVATTPVSAVHIQDPTTGWIVQDELDANPTTSELDANDSIAYYNKANKLVFAYNNGGTMTYVSLPLDGSSTTWTHSTSAP